MAPQTETQDQWHKIAALVMQANGHESMVISREAMLRSMSTPRAVYFEEASDGIHVWLEDL